GGLTRLDVRDATATEAFLKSERPEVIVHAAAERRPDVSERDPDGTAALNVEATRRIAQCAHALGAWMLYISTDYVFDGTSPPYRPQDPPHPLNHYGQTKLAGERAMIAETGEAAALRLGVLFGWVEYV